MLLVSGGFHLVESLSNDDGDDDGDSDDDLCNVGFHLVESLGKLRNPPSTLLSLCFLSLTHSHIGGGGVGDGCVGVVVDGSGGGHIDDDGCTSRTCILRTPSTPCST